MSSRGAAARGRPCHKYPRRDQPPQRREIARAEDPQGQGGLGAECAEARHAGAQKYLVLPDEDAAELEALEPALVEELAPVGALQAVLARRVAVDAWRLARADRIESGLFEERRAASGGLGLALIRDGNGARSFDTLLRYRGARPWPSFWCALRTLKALQVQQTGNKPAGASASRPEIVRRLTTNEPDRCPQHRLDTR